MTIVNLLNDIEENCSDICYLSVDHILKKMYDYEKDDPSTEEIEKILENYDTYVRYLNDFAGPIYRRYQSSIEAIYDEICTHLDLEMDNETIFEMAMQKVEKQSAAHIMQIEDDEFKILTLEKFEQRLEEIKELKYFEMNQDKVLPRIEKMQKEFALVRKVLQI